MSQRAVLVAALVALVASFAAAIMYLATNAWFGAGDLTGMAFWSLPLAGLVSALFRPLMARVITRGPLWRYATFVPLGGILGLAWTAVAALVLGGWILAFSFPVLFCWVAGGLLAGVTAAWYPERRSWPVAGVCAVGVVVALLRANAYAQAPAPQLRVVMAASSTEADVDRFWTEAIGQPGARPGEQGLRRGVRGAGVTGYAAGRPVFTVMLDKGLPSVEVDTLMARIRRAPGVGSVDTLPMAERGRMRTSVSY